MSDIELLRLAAKAYGLPMSNEWNCAAEGRGIIIGNGNGDLRPWNPLEDDGECLRMALDLNLQVRFSYPSQVGQNTREEANKIRCAAYRRAALEMAAEIGRSMP